ncbi:hypothetical protein [Holospora elegans]|uniref:hypothetical protein n=1 Tax=Holospora elegans TaxID=431043 RepID=UPI00139F2CCE
MPPYLPELPPVERLWLYIKQNILNTYMYETIENLENNLCQFMQALPDVAVRSICNAFAAPFYRQAPH